MKPLIAIERIGQVCWPAGAVGTAYKSTHLSFLISNGGTMTLGDAYTVVVSAAGTPVLVGTGTGTVSGVSLGKYAKLVQGAETGAITNTL